MLGLLCHVWRGCFLRTIQETRMADMQGINCHENHPLSCQQLGQNVSVPEDHLHSLENDKDGLVLDQRPVPPLAQFDDTIDASDEDADDRKGETADEQL